jgi:hypothetical protein
MDIFKTCQIINDFIPSNEERAREELIKLLDHCKSENIPYNELINHLIRQLGLNAIVGTIIAIFLGCFNAIKASIIKLLPKHQIFQKLKQIHLQIIWK